VIVVFDLKLLKNPVRLAIRFGNLLFGAGEVVSPEFTHGVILAFSVVRWLQSLTDV